MTKILICGSRMKGYDKLVRAKLNSIEKPFEIIEGQCPNSADEYAEKWAVENDVNFYPYPSTSGEYLKRNIMMVEACDKVICFWDGFSYGSSHTIATAVAYGKPVEVVMIR